MADLVGLARQGYFVPDTYYTLWYAEAHIVTSKSGLDPIDPCSVKGSWCGSDGITTYVFRNFEHVAAKDKEKVKDVTEVALVCIGDSTRMEHDNWSALCDILGRTGRRIGSGPYGGTLYAFSTYSQAKSAYNRCNSYLVREVIRMKNAWDEKYSS